MRKEYHNFIEDYDRYYFQRRAIELKPVLRGKRKDIKILDAGCGAGNFIRFLNKLGFRNLYGIDILSSLIKHAKLQCPNSKISYGNLTSTKFKSNYFDAVLLMDVIEHLPNYGKALKEVKRILKKGGILFITYPNPLLVPTFNLFGKIGLRVYAHDEKVDMTYLLKKAHGFKIKKIKSCMIASKLPPPILKLFEKLEFLLGDRIISKIGFFHVIILEKA